MCNYSWTVNTDANKIRFVARLLFSPFTWFIFNLEQTIKSIRIILKAELVFQIDQFTIRTDLFHDKDEKCLA